MAADPSAVGPTERLADVRESTHRLLLAVGSLGDSDLARPSLLPGWTNAHVLAHLARNADALRRVLRGAQRGEQVRMYDSEESRDADIEAGARRGVAEIVADVAESAARFDEACAATDAATWEVPVRLRMSSPPARGMLDGRWREIEIHWVDLDMGYGPDSWPPRFVAYLLSDRVEHNLPARLPDGVAVEVVASDTGQRWVAGSGSACTITGPSWAVAAYLIGRAAPAAAALTCSGPLPDLGPWG